MNSPPARHDPLTPVTAGFGPCVVMLAGLLAPRAVHAAAPIAALSEEIVRVPVVLQRAHHAPLRQDLVVTIVRPSDTQRHPLLVLLHGRGTNADERRALGRADYPANARYFASLGFVVLIPTRIGYGVTGGPDLEHTGDCAAKRFAAGVAPAVEQTQQLLRYAASLAYVDAGRGIVAGESFGGLVALALAATPVPGLLGTVNIDGGDGGDSLHHADAPCQPDVLAATFADYGRANRRPTLWMYSVNDRLWGPTLPHAWYREFVHGGGRAQYVDLPADKNNGHYIFNRNPSAWHGAFERFWKAIDPAA